MKGTTVSIAINLEERKIHGVIFFPRWVVDSPLKTICYQNEHLDKMKEYRDAGPTYPKMVVDEFAAITFMEECGPDHNDVICCPPAYLPDGYTERIN